MRKRVHVLSSAMVLVAAALSSRGGSADNTTPERLYEGRAATYRDLNPASLERVTTSQHIKLAASSPVAPTEIWRALEHGEKVECLDCIPYVADLLFDGHPRTREISAWWLRRRVFGVFGSGQVYVRVTETLAHDPSEERRAYAAEALGEFLVEPGVKHVARALRQDPSARVRLSSVAALERLNHQGPDGELASTIADESEEEVVLAALRSATRIHVFTGVDAVAKRLGSPSSRVRKRAALALGRLRAVDAVEPLMVLTSHEVEPDAGVREAAVVALGEIADARARAAVHAASLDPHGFVRDAARTALRRL